MPTLVALVPSGCGEPTTQAGVRYTRGRSLEIVLPACAPAKVDDVELRAPDGTLLFQIHPLATVQFPAVLPLGPQVGRFHVAVAMPLADIEARYGSVPLQLALGEGAPSRWQFSLAELAGDGSLAEVGSGAPVPIGGADPVAALGDSQCASTRHHDRLVQWGTVGGVAAVAAVAIGLGLRTRKRWNRVLETLGR